jgi:hypothetical protein
MGIVVVEEPARAAKMLSDAWTDTKTSEGAAVKLGISPATFWRYVNKLEAMGHKAKPRDANGETPQRGGTKRVPV